MSGSLRWVREDNLLRLIGELDQDFLVPLWEAREEATKGTETIDLSLVSRVDTAGVALLIHLISQIKRQGREAKLIGVNEKTKTLVQLYNLPADLIP